MEGQLTYLYQVTWLFTPKLKGQDFNSHHDNRPTAGYQQWA